MRLFIKIFFKFKKIFNYRWRYIQPLKKNTFYNLMYIQPPLENFYKYYEHKTIEEAELVLRGNIECFGTHIIEKINWHKDFFSEFEWTKGKFYTEYELVNINNDADVKVPWELSRCHHLIPLSKAYLLTNNSKYGEKIEKDILNWIDENPFAYSINWTCAMDVAIRAVNWIWAISLANEYFINKDSLKIILNSLYQHGVYIRGNLEKNYGGYSSNHYYSNLVGLIYLGLFFNGNKFANRWLDFAVKEFYKETLIQFYSSGVNYELSTSYHRLMTEMLISVIIQLKNNNYEIPTEILNRAEKAIEYIYYYTRPDGKAPIIGDADDGRLHILGKYIGWDRNDHKYLLAIGHLLFNRKEWTPKEINKYEEALLLLNEIPKAENSNEIVTCSKFFYDAGIAIMRSENNHIMIKVSNQGAYETRGWHTHNDVLSFDLTLGGIPIIIDPGVGQYTGDIKERNYFRSTKAHNTVMIDNIEQNSIGEKISDVWENGGEAKSKIEEWHNDEIEDYLKASNNGYLRLAEPITHTREFCLQKKGRAFKIVDYFVGSGNHILEWNFILEPRIKIQEIDKKKFLLLRDKNRFMIESSIDLVIKRSLFSASYKNKIETLSLCGSTYFQIGQKYNFIVSTR